VPLGHIPKRAQIGLFETDTLRIPGSRIQDLRGLGPGFRGSGPQIGLFGPIREGSELPYKGIRGSGPPNSGSGDLDLGSGTQDLGSGTSDLGSGTSDLETSDVQDPGSGVWDLGSGDLRPLDGLMRDKQPLSHLVWEYTESPQGLVALQQAP